MGEDKVLLKVSVELAEGLTELLHVQQSDLTAENGIRNLAETFCRQHGLDASRVRAPLEEHIRENVAAAKIEEKERKSRKSLQYQPMSGGLERILDRLTVGDRKASSSSRPPPDSVPPDNGASTEDQQRSRQDMQRAIYDKMKSTRRHRNEVFKRLHQDGAERALRIDIQRKNEQQELEDRARSPGGRNIIKGGGATAAGSGGGAPGSGGGGVNRPEERKELYGHLEKLYLDAKRKKDRLERRAQQKEEMANFEVAQYSFAPSIHASQKRVAGISDMGQYISEGFAGGLAGGESWQAGRTRRTREKVEHLRQEKMLREMKGCTFKPSIDERSALMMQRRIRRLKITGSLHEHLYEDAKRREERMIEYSNLVSPEVTFKPDIGDVKYRPPPDSNVDEFFNRLMTQRSTGPMMSREITKNKLQKGAGTQDTDPPFAPRVGRAPHFPRNEEGKPIGHFLYEVGQYVKNLKEEIVEAKLQEEERMRVPQMSEVSRLVYEEKKRKKYQEIFEKLADGTSVVTQECFHLERVPSEFHEFLRPILAYLEETGARFDFEGFAVTMDYVLEKTGVPCSHLLSAGADSIGGGNDAATERGRSEKPRFLQKAVRERSGSQHSYTPRLDPHSLAILEEKGRLDASVPVHERLWSAKAKYDEKKGQRLRHKMEQEMLECTFTPNRLRTDGNLRLTPRSAARGKPQLPFAPAARGGATHDEQIAEVDAALNTADTVIREASAAVQRMKSQTDEV